MNFLKFKVVVVGMLPFLQFVTSQHGRRLLASVNFYGMKLLWVAADLQMLQV